jgi:hypothetical protein
MGRKAASKMLFTIALVVAAATGMTLGVRAAHAATAHRGCSCTNSTGGTDPNYQCSGVSACVAGSFTCSVNCGA